MPRANGFANGRYDALERSPRPTGMHYDPMYDPMYDPVEDFVARVAPTSMH